MSRSLVLLLFAFGFGVSPFRADGAAPQTARELDAQRVAMIEHAAPAVVCIFDTNPPQGGGSGVIIDESGLGLTNFHVVQSFLEKREGFGALSDGQLYRLSVLGIDPGGDIVAFRLHGKERFDAAPLGDSEPLQLGQWIAALGNPFVLAEDYVPTVSVGIISGLHRYQAGQGELKNLLEYADCIQVSTSINPGNSGGPLFDMNGRVIGINGRASFEERGRVNVGLGYAVSINQVKRFLPSLRAGRLCEHGTLGATVERAGPDLIINAVQELSGADRAGVELGDVLLAVNERPMATPNDFNNLVATLPADWPVRVRVRRGGNEMDLSARLERLPFKLGTAYETDREINLAELRRLWRGAARRDLGLSAAGDAFEWRGRIACGDRVAPLHVRQSRDGHIEAEIGETQRAQEQESQSAGGEPAAFAAGRFEIGAGAPPVAVNESLNIRLWDEWRRITNPLVFETEFGVGWEVIGGEEIDGRIASVVENRSEPGVRVRWALNYDDGRVLAAWVGDDRSPRGVEWRPASNDDDALSVGGVRRWMRIAEDRRIEIRVEEAVMTTQPSTQPTVARPAGTIAGAPPHAPEISDGSIFSRPIAAGTQCVVKLYGGAIGREHGYGVGVLVSEDGKIVTAMSILLEGEAIRAVLPDGRRVAAEVVSRDSRRQLALLKVDASGLPHFTLGDSSHVRAGDWVIAAANPFKVADGPEPVSAALGVLCGRAPVDARRRAQDFEYEGAALLVDVVVATPGSAGGALLDLEGNLIGVIGRAVISNRTNTWLNYAIPVEDVANFVRDGPLPAPTAQPLDDATRRIAAIGIRLLDFGARQRPAYVERVRPGSPAARAGVRANDLLLSVGGKAIATCQDYPEAIAALRSGEPIDVVLKRGNEVLTLRISLESRE
ncbi:MAG: trypsin-like peptidase domain-containing protein [Phycisphaerae bacterium]